MRGFIFRKFYVDCDIFVPLLGNPKIVYVEVSRAQSKFWIIYIEIDIAGKITKSIIKSLTISHLEIAYVKLKSVSKLLVTLVSFQKKLKHLFKLLVMLLVYCHPTNS